MDATAQTIPAQPYLSPKARRRQLWLSIHRWLGIVLLVPMAILGVSGSVQVWPEETEALLNPQREVAVDADPASIGAEHLANARVALADYGPVARIQLGEAGEPIVVTSAPYGPPTATSRGPVSRQVWVDPASAEVIDSADSSGGFMRFMHVLHGVFLIPNIGRQIVGIMGLFLTISAITGIYVFWPGMKRVWAALKWQKRDGAMLNIHRQSGFVLSIVLVVEAITGAWISFPGFFATLVEPGVEQPVRGRPGGGGPSGDPLEAEDGAWIATIASARQAFDGRVTAISAPTTENPAWSVTMEGEGTNADVSIPLGGTPEVEEKPAMDGPPPATTRAGAVATWMRQAHYATIGGFGWQVLVFLSGLALTFLSISGIWVWGKRELLAKRRKARA